MTAVLAFAARCWWRLVPLTPPGRRHERNVREELGMPGRHPEHVTRPPSRRNARKLDALQAEAWPEGEWAEVIRMHLEGALMPIRPENKGRYPENWASVSLAIKMRAGWRCECHGECGRIHGGRCANMHGLPSIATGKKVVLTTAHLDHTPENCDPANLRALCQGCHLHYDAEHHAETRRATLAAERASWMEPLFGLEAS